MKNAGAYCLEYLRDDAAGVYPALLFLPEQVRNDVAALWAFHNETAKVAYLVSEPLPGEIRLQWWRDVINPAGNADREGEAEANPLARTLLDAVARHNLPRDGFDRYLQARQFDLYNDAMPDRNTLEAYYGETDSFILQMSSMISGIEQNSTLADVCGHGGVAIGMTQRLKLISRDRALQKTWLPDDLLKSAGLTREEWLSETGSSHEMAVHAAIALASEHFNKAVSAIDKIDKTNRAAFLPVGLAGAELRSMGKAGDLLAGRFMRSPIRQQLALWKCMLFGF